MRKREAAEERGHFRFVVRVQDQAAAAVFVLPCHPFSEVVNPRPPLGFGPLILFKRRLR
jgi:hypothetical protein